MPLGDSITEGVPVAGGYRTELWNRLVRQDGDQIDFVGSRSSGPGSLGDKDSEGHSGWCIDGSCGGAVDSLIDSHLNEWLQAYRPDIVSIHLGTNDLKFAPSGAVVAYRLDETIADVYRANPDAYVVVAKIIPMPAAMEPWREYNELIPRIAGRYREQGRRIKVVDLSTVVRYPSDFADALHPDARGYRKMADTFYPALAEAYDSEREPSADCCR